MPRKSTQHSDENPVPRRTSARIAAVQAASPAKSPVKSPRRKRQSTDQNKAISEDTESQQSQIKSESSLDELNGVETNSSTKDVDSVADSHEHPAKKSKLDLEENKTEEDRCGSDPTNVALVTELSESCPGFEVVERDDVPAHDSEEVKAAISAQGEDGALLVDYVQVDKSEVPSESSIEVKHLTIADVPEEHKSPVHADNSAKVLDSTNSVNGDKLDFVTDTDVRSSETQCKMNAVHEIFAQPVSAPGDGDNNIVTADVEVTSQ